MRSNLLKVLLCVYLFSHSFIFPMLHPTHHYKLSYILNSYRIAIDNQLKSYIFPIPRF
jgi:hypothetical protein